MVFLVIMKETLSVPVATKRAYAFSFLAVLLAFMAVILWMVGPYLLALYLGGTLAMLAYPLYQWFRARKWGPRLAAGAVTALILLLVIAPLAGCSILAVKQGVAIGRQLSELKEFDPKALSVSLSRWKVVQTVIGGPELVEERLKDGIRSIGVVTSAGVLKLSQSIPGFFIQIALSLIAFVFFLMDGKRFVEWLSGLGALESGVQDRLITSFRDTTVSAVLAGLAAAASQAGIIGLSFFALNIPGAFLAGGLTFILAWIPLLGTTPAVLAGLFYLYVHGAFGKMLAMLLLGVAAGFVDNLVRPMVLRGRVGMHPLVGFVAIIGGIHMFGMLGVFIGPILAAMLLALLKLWPLIGKYFGMDHSEDQKPVTEKAS